MPECSSSRSMTTSSIGSSSSPSVVAAEQHLGPRHGKLEALAAHGLDQNAELQLAAAGDLHRVAFLRFGDAQRDIAFGLAQQAVADHAARHLVAFGAGERRIVDAEGHRERRRIDRLGRQRLGRPRARRWCAQPWRRAARRARRCRRRWPRRGATRSSPRKASTLETRPCSTSLPSWSSTLTGWFGAIGAGGDAAGDDAAEIGIGLEDGAEQAERSFLDLRRRDMR